MVVRCVFMVQSVDFSHFHFVMVHFDYGVETKFNTTQKVRPMTWARKDILDRKSVESRDQLSGVDESDWNIFFERIRFSLALA